MDNWVAIEQAVIGALIFLAGGMAWLFRLEGKANKALDVSQSALEAAEKAKEVSLEYRNEVVGQLNRLEGKIDARSEAFREELAGLTKAVYLMMGSLGIKEDK